MLNRRFRRAADSRPTVRRALRRAPRSAKTPGSGDPLLLARLFEVLPRELRGGRVSAAVITPTEVRRAHIGATDETEYELGSITKTFTGALLAALIDEGAVSVRTTLAEIFGPVGSASAITLGELARHTSGLPCSPAPVRLGTRLAVAFRGADPSQDVTVDDLLAAAASAPLTPGRFEYSNFGASLLGAALARAGGAEYAELIAAKVCAPLGLTATYVPTRPEEVAGRGRTALGRPAEPWLLGAEAPSGAIRSTLNDAVTYVRAHLAGGLGLAPSQERHAYGWMTDEELCWHNGMTGGYASWAGMGAKRAAILLADRAIPLDAAGEALALA